MPLIPRGLTPRFIDRIKQEIRNLTTPGVIDRTIQRVKDEILPYPTRPPPVVEPSTAVTPVPLDIASIMQAFASAGRQWRIVRARYHGNDRDLEPLSFRWNDKDDPAIPLVHCYCHKDRMTEAFKLKKFESVAITNRFYGPRASPPRGTEFDNEFARGGMGAYSS